MSFNLSPGTLDTVAGVFAPPKRRRGISKGGSSGKGGKKGGMNPAVLASLMSGTSGKSAAVHAGSTSFTKPPAQTKFAFGGGSSRARSARAVATMDRTARRVPEVMVRITGRQTGGGHVLANFTYISRLGHEKEAQVTLYTSDGDELKNGKHMQILAQDWQAWETGDDARRQGSTSISMILSMPAGTDPERLREAALEFAREEMANRSWVAALHEDRDHPHVHLTIARRDYDGRRFHPNRDDLFRYRQRFAEKLRDQGIEANATPARARGIDPKHEHIGVRKMREKGQVPRIDVSRQERADRLREAGIPDPVEAIIRQRQEVVRAAYERSIGELSASNDPQDREIAASLAKFTKGLPAPEANSVRAPREQRRDLADGARGGPLMGTPSDVATLDPVAAAMARSQLMRERLEAKKTESRDASGGQRDAARDRPSALSDSLRSLMDEAARPKDAPMPDSAEEMVRRTLEREREQRERDRSRDRGGPER